jgi:hypothetical protein
MVHEVSLNTQVQSVTMELITLDIRFSWYSSVDSCCYGMTARWENIPEQFIRNGSVNMFPRQQIRKQPLRYFGAITMETVSSMWLVPKCYKQSQSSSREDSWQAVLYWSPWSENLSLLGWRIVTVRSLCQGTTSEDTAGWKRLSGCCDLWNVEISGGALIKYNYDICAKVLK